MLGRPKCLHNKEILPLSGAWDFLNNHQALPVSVTQFPGEGSSEGWEAPDLGLGARGLLYPPGRRYRPGGRTGRREGCHEHSLMGSRRRRKVLVCLAELCLVQVPAGMVMASLTPQRPGPTSAPNPLLSHLGFLMCLIKTMKVIFNNPRRELKMLPENTEGRQGPAHLLGIQMPNPAVSTSLFSCRHRLSQADFTS